MAKLIRGLASIVNMVQMANRPFLHIHSLASGALTKTCNGAKVIPTIVLVVKLFKLVKLYETEKYEVLQ